MQAVVDLIVRETYESLHFGPENRRNETFSRSRHPIDPAFAAIGFE